MPTSRWNQVIQKKTSLLCILLGVHLRAGHPLADIAHSLIGRVLLILVLHVHCERRAQKQRAAGKVVRNRPGVWCCWVAPLGISSPFMTKRCSFSAHQRRAKDTALLPPWLAGKLPLSNPMFLCSLPCSTVDLPCLIRLHDEQLCGGSVTYSAPTL